MCTYSPNMALNLYQAIYGNSEKTLRITVPGFLFESFEEISWHTHIVKNEAMVGRAEFGGKIVFRVMLVHREPEEEDGIWRSHDGYVSCWIIMGQVEDWWWWWIGWKKVGKIFVDQMVVLLFGRGFFENRRKPELWIGYCPYMATPPQLICECQWLEAPLPLKTRTTVTRRPPRLSPLQSSHAPDRYLHYQRTFQTIL